MTAPLLSVRDLHVHFKVRGEGLLFPAHRTLKAVNGVSFDLQPGETLGIVGESGCGKSTLARALLNLIPATSGQIAWLGQDMRGAGAEGWQQVRRHVQMVFQDPLASLNPRMNIAQIIGEPLRTHQPQLAGAEVLRRVKEMLVKVGLSEAHLYRYPHEFSGGQCQRIGIARALILKPRLIVCDEPVSALDVSIQAQVINLLQDLQQEMQLALIFIAHDLAVVKHVSQRILVMYLGRTMELAPKQALYADPKHPYTRALLSAVPLADPRRERAKSIELLSGDLPSPLDPPSGCVFRTRCPHAFARCPVEVPPLLATGSPSQAACWLYAGTEGAALRHAG
ncbi:oligopeptide/dipeptide ABC transporter ATP-binding protein [Ramlibacter sp.]|uniref:ABC transporter ATP-binding protein n=1 Tax=Ramlibacter sp. TaxID=1917967 RepID=UPI002BC185F2|nr:oligopeptide/dipeptide ABC transporter ATP-binding protein [Ramlibacter sp.]HWI82229.1 oligopeptide/dipeptide ABC transporter ATP-binding protein [Ramlibacter sp.]